MNVEAIEMDVDVAKEKLKAYRSRKHADADEEYRACERAYEALANGTPLIDLPQAIRDGGLDELERPRLAASRADRKEIEFRWDGRNALFNGSRLSRGDTRGAALRLGVGFPDWPTRDNSWKSWYALVPMVPADVRPETGQLKDWWILWEVDHWAEQRQIALPPTDPYLLKHVGGDLWAVLAAWDLTDLERSVMAGLRRQ